MIPVTEKGIKDWDCVGAVEWGELEGELRGLKEGERGEEEGGKDRGEGGGGEGEAGEKGDGDGEGRVRQGNFEGEEMMDGVHGVKGISEDVIRHLRSEVSTWPPSLKTRPLILLDGFLLLGLNVPSSLKSLFDIKILLLASYADAKERRERRNGYVTLEGFWEDPEGYFDDVVWPAYVREHGWVFEGGGGEGVVDVGKVGREGVRVWEEGGLEGGVGWVVGVVREGLEGGEGEGGKEGGIFG